MTRWTYDDIPDQRGRTAIVTGANTGLGFETARMLAGRGARVVLACRDTGRGVAAAARIRAETPAGAVTCARLDLADLDSVAAFAVAYRSDHDRLDLLVNNAGVLYPPLRRTRQGFELQFGTNHLGHFALTGRLLPLLLATPAARVVTVASNAHRTGRIDLDDLNWERRRYRRFAAYAQSKLANLLFTLELRRRLTAADAPIRATAAHPGWTYTGQGRAGEGFVNTVGRFLAMTTHDGALPTLRAATDPDAASGSYWGPAHRLQYAGPPVAVTTTKRAQDVAVAQRLWAASERLTGVAVPLGRPGQ
ncbi:NAD(P)-dependent dehydrogenase, short-chain alcohol dehydrogenase family [Micromonospora phaseoli]|uniref:NAD(P)-dependent dehydrogenase, short-chain alcohol dehydrogenase family n=1 Tax=Micromonospora phaseoli TaxID=1144548 RepID=A0A1H6UT95_9ACTN|nr:oxidoreductase [Micromonospora phaseoli]PZV99002.1 NAD(P)-dependent dehydrogenase (short-subunit alcohol dehydrogenase family) [Micromonospora phaseoli]GIJ76247.1 short-chain dehydrogenase [Micromonospora phaseoli]SEI91275.1 NAD(P)-dependent dehydrogenase, short-chain alcohol dehydrogenase family [Micromonospora phaseoli]